MRDFRLPLTRHERELLLAVGISDPDLARRVRLPPVVDGWATLQLDEAELKSLLWVACQAPGEDQYSGAAAELRAATVRIARVMHGKPALPDLEPVEPLPRPAPWLPAWAEPLAIGVTLHLAEGECHWLEGRPAVVEDFPPQLRRPLVEAGAGPARLLLGEALLLADRLDETAMDPQTSDIEAHGLIRLVHRIEAALDREWNGASAQGDRSAGLAGSWYMRPRAIIPEQPIPVALRSSELELLRGLPTIPAAAAAALEPGEAGVSGPRMCLNLAQLEELLESGLGPEPDERVARLEKRLVLIWRAFTGGRD